MAKIAGRPIPIVATLVVLAAVAVMVRLGFWQLDRLEQKEALLARYAAAAELPPLDPATMMHIPVGHNVFRNPEPEELHYRRASFNCSEVVGWRDIAGRNADQQTGYVHVAQCMSSDWLTFDGPGFAGEIVLGWSQKPSHPVWNGGLVTGTIGPGGALGWQLVADPPLAGLQASALPDPGNLPNNHLAYAGQWFFFALTALVIYGIALRKRMKP